MKLAPPLLLALPLALSLPIAYADETESESQTDMALQSQPETKPSEEKSDDSGWYMGAFFSAQEQDWDFTTREFEAAGGLLGYRINRFWAIEARLATGTSGYDRHYSHIEGSQEGDYSEDIDKQSAVLLKAFVPVTDNLSLYGMIGAARTTLEVSGIGEVRDEDGTPIGRYRFTESFSNEDMTYGGGLNYTIKGKIELFAEYQVLPKFEPNTQVSAPNAISVDWESINAGINYRF